MVIVCKDVRQVTTHNFAIDMHNHILSRKMSPPKIIPGREVEIDLIPYHSFITLNRMQEVDLLKRFAILISNETNLLDSVG